MGPLKLNSVQVNIDGGLNLPFLPGVEAALDTQTAAGIIYPLPSSKSSGRLKCIVGV